MFSSDWADSVGKGGGSMFHPEAQPLILLRTTFPEKVLFLDHRPCLNPWNEVNEESTGEH